MKGRSILIVSYYFPPLGLSGVQRPMKLAKYLHRLGWKVFVLTVKPIAYWQRDESLLSDLPPEIPVFRAGSADPARLAYLLGKKIRTESGFSSAPPMVWDSKIGFAPFAYWKAARLIKKFGIGTLWTSSPPPSIHRVGARLKRKLGIRWVADFRDPWEVESPEAGSPLWSKRQEKLKTLLAQADGVTTVDDEIRDYLSGFSGNKPASTVFNGYDPEDLPPTAAKKSEVFTLAYGGTLNAACNPHLFLKGLARWKKEKQVPFRLFLIGRTLGLPVEEWLEELGLEENVILTGYLPHRQALLELSKADLFLLFVGMEEQYRFTLTAKIFEYIGLGKPTLAVAPQNGAVAGFMAKYQAGRLAASEEQVAEGLDFYHRRWQAGKNLAIPKEVRNRFGWDKEAVKLASILEGIA